MPTTISSALTDDEWFVQQVRRDLRDTPQYRQPSIISNGTSAVYKLQSFPVWDNPGTAAVPNLVVGVGATFPGAAQTLVEDRAALAGGAQVYVDRDSGYLFWYPTTPPASGAGSPNIWIQMYKVRWLDRDILDALYAGLKAIFPKVGQETVYTFTLNVNQWEYTLPAVFADPRVRILRLEWQNLPATIERFHPITGYRVNGLRTVQIPRGGSLTPGSTVRVSYYGPYERLADLEDQMSELPILYAKFRLLTTPEAQRARADTAAVNQQEGGNQPGSSMEVGLQLYNTFQQRLADMVHPTKAPRAVSTYAL